ncbi:MAG: DUF58 domain-containing protein [Cyanobacteriota bacterium]|nr:DUF58 domain-containing protein [Cyanobacteriota bacterium]
MARLRQLRERIERRLSREAPRQRLGLNNLYIFPNSFGGLWLAATVVLYLVGINTASNGPLLLAFLCTGLFLLALFLTQANLQGLELAISTPTPGFAGELVPYPIALHSNRERYLLRLRFGGQPLLLQPLVPAGSSVVSPCWRPQQRGLQRPGRLLLYGKAPLGVFTCWCYWQPPQPQLIYPAAVPGPVLEQWRPLPRTTEAASGSRAGGAEQLRELSPHRPEEGLQRVAWKQLARGRGWQAKRFEQEAEQELLLSPDPALPLEQALEALCARVLELSQAAQGFALELPSARLPHGSGRSHRDAALQALALVKA